MWFDTDMYAVTLHANEIWEACTTFYLYFICICTEHFWSTIELSFICIGVSNLIWKGPVRVFFPPKQMPLSVLTHDWCTFLLCSMWIYNNKMTNRICTSCSEQCLLNCMHCPLCVPFGIQLVCVVDIVRLCSCLCPQCYCMLTLHIG